MDQLTYQISANIAKQLDDYMLNINRSRSHKLEGLKSKLHRLRECIEDEQHLSVSVLLDEILLDIGWICKMP